MKASPFEEAKRAPRQMSNTRRKLRHRSDHRASGDQADSGFVHRRKCSITGVCASGKKTEDCRADAAAQEPDDDAPCEALAARRLN
jgi:hypothetical protein